MARNSNSGADISVLSKSSGPIPNDVPGSILGNSSSESSSTDHYSRFFRVKDFLPLKDSRSSNDVATEFSLPENQDSPEDRPVGSVRVPQYDDLNSNGLKRVNQSVIKENEPSGIIDSTKTESLGARLSTQKSIRRLQPTLKSSTKVTHTNTEIHQKLQQKENTRYEGLFSNSEQIKTASPGLEGGLYGYPFLMSYYLQKGMSIISPLLGKPEPNEESSRFDNESSLCEGHSRYHLKVTTHTASSQLPKYLEASHKTTQKTNRKKARSAKKFKKPPSYKTPEPYYRNRRDITQEEINEIKNSRVRAVGNTHRFMKPVPIPFNHTPEAFRQASAPPRKFEKVQPATYKDGWQVQGRRRRRDIKMDWITRWSRNVERASASQVT